MSWVAEAAACPVPLEVDGMTAALSHFRGVDMQAEAGVVRLNLTNYTGVIFLASNGAPSTRVASSARGVKRRSGSVPKTPAPHDPAESDTVKKPKGQQGFAQASSAGFPGAASAAGEACEHSASDSEASCDDEELDCLAHVYDILSNDIHPNNELAVSADISGPDKGVFALLGNGKNPAKTGAVKVTASAYDPGKKRPEELTGGRKSGDGCIAMPSVETRGESPSKSSDLCCFEFSLQGGLELRPQSYSLRNGSKDYGTFPMSWLLQAKDPDGHWVTLVEEKNCDALDGNRQEPRLFVVPGETSGGNADSIFSSVFRIKREGLPHERHPLWLLSVELFGTLRRKQAAAPPRLGQDQPEGLSFPSAGWLDQSCRGDTLMEGNGADEGCGEGAAEDEGETLPMELSGSSCSSAAATGLGPSIATGATITATPRHDEPQPEPSVVRKDGSTVVCMNGSPKSSAGSAYSSRGRGGSGKAGKGALADVISHEKDPLGWGGSGEEKGGGTHAGTKRGGGDGGGKSTAKKGQGVDKVAMKGIASFFAKKQ